jgi:hypothetical protein
VGATGTASDALSVGVSGVVRRFTVAEFTAAPARRVSTTGKGISLDALLPVVPGSMNDRANALTLTGSFVTGSGIADLYSGLTGGVGFPALPNAAGTMPAPTYTADVDNGLVSFDANGVLRAVAWRSVLVGVQYYLPPSGKLWVAANYSQMESSNAGDFGVGNKIFTRSRWASGNLFWDALPSVRLGVAYAWFSQSFADGTDAHNHRVSLSAFYIF